MNNKTTISLVILVGLMVVSARAQVSDKQIEKNRKILKSQLLGGNPFRVVTNQLYNAEKSVLWEYVGGKVTSKIDGIVIVYYEPSNYPGMAKYFAVRNYAGDSTDGKWLRAIAMRVGEWQWGNTPLELWDCGTLPKPKPASGATNSVTKKTP